MSPLLLALVLAGSNGVGTGGLTGFQPQSSSGFNPSNAPNVVQATTAALTLYVDPTGSDSNDCTSTGAGACLTIQGAVNKSPKYLRHGVVVNVAAGTYGCFYVTGFVCDTGVQSTTGGLFVDAFAAFANSTLATGSATGTATSSTAGSATTFGTLTDSGATWTVNDLKGRFVTAGGTTRVISSNTSTAITISGTWTSPGAVAYTIQDPGANINTACASPATGLQASSANNAAILLTDNSCQFRTQTLTIRGFRISNASGDGVVTDSAGTFLQFMQVRNSASGGSQFVTGMPTQLMGRSDVGRVDAQDNDFLNSATSVANTVIQGKVDTRRSLFRGGSVGIQLQDATSQASLNPADVQGSTTPVFVQAGYIGTFNARLTCASTGIGVAVGASNFANVLTSSSALLTNVVIATCGTGLLVGGSSASADVTAISGAAATTGIAVGGGASVAFSAAGNTMTAGTNDISLDTGAVTATLADAPSGTNIRYAPTGSVVRPR